MATAVNKQKAAITEMRLSLKQDMAFEDIVAALRLTLTLPELPGFRGCRPCLSGLDRLVIDDIVMRGMR